MPWAVDGVEAGAVRVAVVGIDAGAARVAVLSEVGTLLPLWAIGRVPAVDVGDVVLPDAMVEAAVELQAVRAQATASATTT
jgi:hypothetical protein